VSLWTRHPQRAIAPRTRGSLHAHLAETLPGVVPRIAQRLLAPTLCIPINTLPGRPPVRATIGDEATSKLLGLSQLTL